MKNNELEFYISENINHDHIVVIDHDCMKERIYIVGDFQELAFETVKIESIKQVVDSWKSGETWF